MKREIKFRVWDKAKHRMLSVDQLAFGPNGELVSIYSYGPDFSNDSDALMDDKPDLNEAVLMQYTGVDDANNIPIYEGDIIRGLFTADEGLTLDGDRIPYFGQVEWCSQSNCLGWYVESQDGGMFELEQCHAKISLDNVTGEVIGNIHNNPELLED